MKQIAKQSIKELLENDKFIIPLYQRNFSWGRDEIHQLLADIEDSKNDYYIGSIVVAPRNNNVFEVIDGQQRHTVLTLINAVFQQENKEKERNLFFEARESHDILLHELYSNFSQSKVAFSKKNGDKGITNILEAVKDIEEFLEKNKKRQEPKEFLKKFYNRTFIYRTVIPEETDVNHYFEIMNNRGEQLEKHEILKAALMERLPETKKQSGFSIIWDACSFFNDHVKANFSSNDRTKLFGENYTDTITKEKVKNFLDRVCNSEEPHNISGKWDNDTPSTILELIKNHSLPQSFTQTTHSSHINKFKSIIDFPNFLLQVLKLNDNDVSLDDKSLLDSFGYPTPEKLPDPEDFIFQLLNARILFDEFVIKQGGSDTEWTWDLSRLKKENGGYDYEVSCQDPFYRKKLKMIQAMFHVTFSTNNYKNWLQNYLKFLIHNQDNLSDEKAIFQQLKNQAIKYFQNNINDNFFNSGLNTPRFLFNFVDYLLWEIYHEKLRGKTPEYSYMDPLQPLYDIILKVKNKFYNFKFTQRSSIEHLFPQSRVEDITENNFRKSEILNNFGNLCLISRSSNSLYNDDLPIQKKNDSRERNESLKQDVMFESFDSNNSWNAKEILEHKELMNKLLIPYYKK